MNNGFTKLFGSIVTSSIWQEPDQIRIIWITMLAIADYDGKVDGSIVGLANLANVSVEDCAKAIKTLQSPDEYSRTKEHKGRRIAEVDGGWTILNYEKYRNKGKSRAPYYRQYRKAKKQENATGCATPPQQDATHTETDTDTEVIVTPEEFVQYWNSFDSLSKIKAFGKGRTTKLKTRLKEEAFSRNWREIIRKLAGSPFHTGQGNSGWRAGSDWLLKNDSNYAKILELPDPLDGVTREVDETELALLIGNEDE